MFYSEKPYTFITSSSNAFLYDFGRISIIKNVSTIQNTTQIQVWTQVVSTGTEIGYRQHGREHGNGHEITPALRHMYV